MWHKKFFFYTFYNLNLYIKRPYFIKWQRVSYKGNNQIEDTSRSWPRYKLKPVFDKCTYISLLRKQNGARMQIRTIVNLYIHRIRNASFVHFPMKKYVCSEFSNERILEMRKFLMACYDYESSKMAP